MPNDVEVNITGPGSVTATVTAGDTVEVTVRDANRTTWDSLPGKPEEFPPEAHTHAIVDVTGLQAALDGKQPLGSYAASSHTHTSAQITDFVSAVVAAAPPTTNASLMVSGTLPDARLSANIARTSDVSAAVAALVAAAPATLDTLNELAAALGNDASFATTVTNALASRAPLASPTFTGTVSGVTKSHVGLGNVDNTSDANKPVSVATQTALDGKAATAHTHGQITADGKLGTSANQIVVTGFGGLVGTASSLVPSQIVTETTYAAFLPVGGSLDTAFSGLQTTLDGKAAASHAHGSITSDGKIGSTSGLIVVTTTAGLLTTAATIGAGSVSGLAAVATSGAYADLSGTPAAYSLPNATTTTLGGMIVGTGLGVSSGTVSVTYGTTSGTACQGNDSRLSDARTPTAHTHTLSAITDAGTAASRNAPAAGDAASSEVVLGADTRLTNARSPTTHSHAAADITSGTIATARLGSGTADATTFLRGDSTFAAPPVTSVDGGTGVVTITKARVYEFLRGSAPSDATGTNGSYTWTLPSDAKLVEYFMVGAGGGGGSGRRNAAGTARFGGGGGASGGVNFGVLPVASLSTTTLSIRVGAGGAGGAARTADNTDGANGSAPSEATLIGFGSTTNERQYINAGRCGGGGGGTQTAGTAGDRSAFSTGMLPGGPGGASSVTAAAGNGGYPPWLRFSANGAGGGGGISSADVSYGGGLVPNDGIGNWTGVNTTNLSGGVAPGGAGSNGVQQTLMPRFPGSSGSGGAAGNSTTAGGNGGNGAFPGGGGGGGGASFNGYNSGAGGNGADGYVRITVWS